jgi:multiple sugar transport system ATP-binding protein
MIRCVMADRRARCPDECHFVPDSFKGGEIVARVALEKITKCYPGNAQPAVDAIDLDIRDREFIVLVGPSGCGKSTTLRMVAGLEEITAGTIKIGDRVVNDLAPKDRDIAMVFQNYALYPHLSVYKNMAFGLKLRRRELGLTQDQIHTRVLEAARTLHIEEYLDRRPKALSGGQRQRVALGRAIVRNPKAFLFDEPLSNLDAKLRVETRAELKRLHQRLQTTTIYVTHDQEEAMTLGDRIVVMKDGVIQQCAAPLEVYDRPVNRFVAGFVGTPPMNFIAGKVVLEGTAPWFEFGGQRVRLPGFMMAAAAKHAGRDMILGVRPEGLCPGHTESKFSGADNGFDAKINVLEPLGDRVDLALSMEGNDHLVCRADAHQYGKLAVGGIIRFYMDLGRVHLFEPGANGANITRTRASEPAVA